MTIAEIKRELDALGATYPRKATKAELEALLASSKAASATDEPAAPVEETTTTEEPAAPTIMETTTLLNVRSAPEKTPATIAGGPLNAGTRVTVVEVSDGWARLDDGTYCMAEFLREG